MDKFVLQRKKSILPIRLMVIERFITYSTYAAEFLCILINALTLRIAVVNSASLIFSLRVLLKDGLYWGLHKNNI